MLDATRAAHVGGVGTYGSGFVSNPAEVRAKILRCGCSLASYRDLVAPGTLATVTHLRRESSDGGFPRHLGPLHLVLTPMRVTAKEEGAGSCSYTIEFSGQSPLAGTGLGNSGRCSPRSALPEAWPDAPAAAASLCWAYPIHGIREFGRDPSRSGWSFLEISTNTELRFVTYGALRCGGAWHVVVVVVLVASMRCSARLPLVVTDPM